MNQKIRKEYLKALFHSPKSSHLKLLKRAKNRLLQQKVMISLNKGNAMKLKRLASKNDVEVAEMTDKIVSDYLKRR